MSATRYIEKHTRYGGVKVMIRACERVLDERGLPFDMIRSAWMPYNATAIMDWEDHGKLDYFKEKSNEG